MKKIKTISLIIIMLSFIFTFISCKKDNDEVKEEKYTISFLYEDGTEYKKEIVNKNEQINVESPVKEGHTFNGWYIGNEKQDLPKVYDKDTTLTAKFTVNQYTYKFIVDGNIIKEEKVNYGTSITYPNNPIKPTTEQYSYEFTGWDNDVTVVKKDEVFNASFKEVVNQYTYTFYNEDGTIIKQETVDYGTKIAYPTNPEKEATSEYNFTFVGWDHQDIVITNDIEFKPIFDGIKNQYTYTFYNEIGEVIKTDTINYGNEIIYPANPEKEATPEYTYTFVGWDHQDTVITNNIEFRPVFTSVKNTYTYTFYDDNNNIIKTETLEYGSNITYPVNPEKEATPEYTYSFVSWDHQDTTLTSDIEFRPIFDGIKNKYTYTFYDDNNNVIKTETLEYGSKITYPANPKKESTVEYTYTFKGWDHQDTVLTNNIEFKPIFEQKIRQYQCKFIDDNDLIIKEEMVYYGTLPTIPNVSDKIGYKFIGWDKEVVEVTEDVIYRAQYEKVDINLEGKKLSILGDSISTFYAEGSEMNSYYSGNNQYYYPLYSSTIKTVQATWWYQLLKNTKMELGINNSWSGSCAYGSSSSAGMSSGRINTIDENGMPDIVIIYLGTNDCASGFSVNEFSNAIKTMITKIREIGSPDIFITTLGYSAYTGMSYKDSTRVSYNTELRNIANAYNCGIVPLDDYIVDTSYSFYLGDYLHYNAKGATLLSKIYEKSIKEYYGLEYNEEIKVEHKEVLPEDVLGKITVTADHNTDFWSAYANNVFFAPLSSFSSPTYSYRMEIKKDENNNYYVSAIHNIGDTAKYNSDYVLVISDGHENKTALIDSLKSVVVGSKVIFDESLNLPMEVTFKVGTGSGENQGGTTPDTPVIEGQLHIGAYNDGVWTKYESTSMIYSYSKLDQGSTYANFYMIGITKDSTSDEYKVTYLKDVDVTSTFDKSDYFILIYRDLADKSYYENCTLDTVIKVTGDITSGNCYLEFK